MSFHPGAGSGAEERRRQLVRWLQQADQPLTGAELASRLGVSRQVIVQDMAVLRAAGTPVVATPRGYLLLPAALPGLVRDVLAVCHTPDQTRAELMLLVESGCRVLDVIVEHPLYGELRGELQLGTPAEVEDFLQRVEAEGARLLSSLTGGFHLHTVESRDPQAVIRAREGLARLGILRGDESSSSSRG
ncbi:MAG: transcription repressor NadR [Limnochordales bacterium]|nr:transcription repressor NadR [Limnochordales bacterium]